MRGKGWEERGPKACLKNSDFGTPMCDTLALSQDCWRSLKRLSCAQAASCRMQCEQFVRCCHCAYSQRTQSGGQKRGQAKPYEETLHRKQFLTPLTSARFSPPSLEDRNLSNKESRLLKFHFP